VKTYREGEEQPVALYDDHGTLYVDNGDRTVTLAGDQDGERDTPWALVETETPLHTSSCRELNLTILCDSGEVCARDDRAANVLGSQVHRNLCAAFGLIP
jgi:hypothetical protein